MSPTPSGHPLDSASGRRLLSSALAFAAGVTAPSIASAALGAISIGTSLARRRRLAAWRSLPIWFAAGAIVGFAHHRLDPVAALLRAWQAAGFEERSTPIVLEGRVLDLERHAGDRLAFVVGLERFWLPGGGEDRSGSGRGARARLTVPLPEAAPLPWNEGDRIRLPARLGRPRSFRNPGAFDYGAYLAARGIRLTGTVKSLLLVERLDAAPRWRRLLPSLRRRAVSALHGAAGVEGKTTAAFLAALLLGERQSLPPALEEALQRAGVFHIIALSGMNVGLVLLMCAGVLSLLPATGRGKWLLLLAAVLIYWGTVRHGGSIARASLMVLVHLGGKLSGRRVAPLGALAVSGLLLLAWRPAWILDSGFQLSYAATFGLLAALRSRVPAVARRPRGRSAAAGVLLGSLRTSAAALLATAPFTALHFHTLVPASLLANLIAVPLASLSLLLAVLVVSAAGPAPPIAALLSSVAGGLLRALEWTSHLCAALPGGFLFVLPPSLALAAAWASALSVLALTWNPSTRRLAAALAVSLATVVVAAGRGVRPSGRLEVIALDVGQGDAILTRFPNGLTLLCDAGGVLPGDFDLGARVVAPALRGLGHLRIDILAITHAHRDHIGGAASVLRQLRPRALWLGAMPQADPGVESLLARAEEAGVAVVQPRRGVRLGLGGGKIEILHPAVGDSQDGAPRNDDSLVLRIALGEQAALLTGDAEAGVEEELSSGPLPISAGLLKVAHHGSASSTRDRFLDRVGPTLALISVGPANPFHHPSPKVIDRLGRLGASILRTDREGAVGAWTDGRRPWTGAPLTAVPPDEPTASESLRGGRYEAEQEDDERDGRQPPAAGGQGRQVVERPRMACPQESEQHPEQDQMVSPAPQTQGAEDEDPCPRHDRVGPRGDGIEHVPAVQLADRQEVEGGGEQSEPGGGEGRVQLDRHVRSEVEVERVDHLEEQAGGQDDRSGMQGLARGRGMRQSVEEDRQGHHEPGERPGYADVEERDARGERGPDANQGAEGAEEVRPRKEEGQGGLDAIVPAGQVVPHLVSPQYRQHAQGVGESIGPGNRVGENPQQELARNAVLRGHERSGDGRREERRQETDQIDVTGKRARGPPGSRRRRWRRAGLPVGRDLLRPQSVGTGVQPTAGSEGSCPA
jgi:competence protein ComEC